MGLVTVTGPQVRVRNRGGMIIDFREVRPDKVAQRISERIRTEETFADIRTPFDIGGGSASGHSMRQFFGTDIRKDPARNLDRITRVAEYAFGVKPSSCVPSWTVTLYRRKQPTATQSYLVMEFTELVCSFHPIGQYDWVSWSTIPWLLAHANDVTRVDRVNVSTYASEALSFKQLLTAYNRMCVPVGLMKQRIDVRTDHIMDMFQPQEVVQFRQKIASLVFVGFEDEWIWPRGISLQEFADGLRREK